LEVKGVKFQISSF